MHFEHSGYHSGVKSTNIKKIFMSVVGDLYQHIRLDLVTCSFALADHTTHSSCNFVPHRLDMQRWQIHCSLQLADAMVSVTEILELCAMDVCYGAQPKLWNSDQKVCLWMSLNLLMRLKHLTILTYTIRSVQLSICLMFSHSHVKERFKSRSKVYTTVFLVILSCTSNQFSTQYIRQHDSSHRVFSFRRTIGWMAAR